MYIYTYWLYFATQFDICLETLRFTETNKKISKYGKIYGKRDST